MSANILQFKIEEETFFNSICKYNIVDIKLEEKGQIKYNTTSLIHSDGKTLQHFKKFKI